MNRKEDSVTRRSILDATTKELPDVATAGTPAIRPEFIRLPKPGTLCPHTGLSRSMLNTLILPARCNNFRPPVRSISLRKLGSKNGVRLIQYSSLLAYLRSFQQIDPASQMRGEADGEKAEKGGTMKNGSGHIQDRQCSRWQ